MDTVRVFLRKRNGEPVGSVNIPKMVIPPKIILWGVRYFVLVGDAEYWEDMCWVPREADIELD